jgi:flagellar biosynthesis regulator FlaF
VNTPAALYGRTAKTGFTPRLLEAELLTQCSTDLRRAAAALPDAAPLIGALERNRTVWSRLALHLRHGDTDLDDPHRLSILKLAAIVFLRTASLCEAPAKAEAEALARINLALAAGLRGQAPAPR